MVNDVACFKLHMNRHGLSGTRTKRGSFRSRCGFRGENLGSEATSFCSFVEAGWWLDLDTRLMVLLRCVETVHRKFA